MKGIEMKYLPQNEIAVDNFEDAVTIAKILLANRNVVCLSEEEQLYIVNWEFSWNSDRNDIIFRSREDWEYEEMQEQKALEEEELEWERERERQQNMVKDCIKGQMSLFDEEDYE